MTRPLTEAEAWREAAPLAANGAPLWRLAARTDAMRARFFAHCMWTELPFDNLSRSLACLFLACEAEGEA